MPDIGLGMRYGGGAEVVSLVKHSADARTPVATSWLLAGSVTVALAGIALAARSLPDGEFPAGVLSLRRRRSPWRRWPSSRSALPVRQRSFSSRPSRWCWR